MINFLGALITQTYDFLCTPMNFGNFSFSLFDVFVLSCLLSLLGYFIGRLFK